VHVTVVEGREISADLIATWRRLQENAPELANPFFCPEYFVAAARARKDVFLAIIEEGREVSGLFPFQRSPMGYGGPVGGRLSDYHGLIALPGKIWDPRTLISQCGLRAWNFDHLPASQDTFQDCVRSRVRSPAIDLSGGYAAYVANRKIQGSGQIGQCSRKLRKLEREAGPVRFEMHCASKDVLQSLMLWKGSQYVRTGGADLFRFEWVRRLISEIHAAQSDSFGGILSALYAGDTLAAVHFGMRSSTVLHYWFPAYLPQFGKYSVGMILLLKIAENAPSMNLRRIDLGKGEQRYKMQLMNDSVRLLEGWVTLPTILSRLHNLARCGELAIRARPRILEPLRWVARGVRRYAGRVE